VTSAETRLTAAEAAESVDGGEAVGIPSLWDAASGMAAALRQGTTVAQEASRLGVELTRIARGRSDVAPAKGDRRFTDPAWTSNPVFRMIQQTYLASAQALDRVVAQLGEGASGTRAEQARFAVNIMTSAAAPTNFLVSNPADEPTCNQCVDVLDLRITATPVIRNGTAYAAWETAIVTVRCRPWSSPAHSRWAGTWR